MRITAGKERAQLGRDVGGQEIGQRLARQPGERRVRLRRNLGVRVVGQHDEKGDLLADRARQQAARGEQADVRRRRAAKKEIDEWRTITWIHAVRRAS